jgi:hypothetical protein
MVNRNGLQVEYRIVEAEAAAADLGNRLSSLSSTAFFTVEAE